MTPQDAALLASLTGFTPGPCRAVGEPTQTTNDGIRASISVFSQDRWDRAYEADPYDTDAADDAASTCCIWGEITDEDRANAELYAAAPDLHRIATEQAVEIERLREALEDAEYDLAQWCECPPELIKAGFNMDGTADVLAKVSAALQVQP